MKKIFKKLILTGWLTALASGIAFMFWHNEWKYNLPTPVPADYQAVATGSVIDLSHLQGLEKGKPVFLHFFNPACPCSRFNMPHFKSLEKKYGDRFSFAMVVVNNPGHLTEQEIQEKYGVTIPVFFNADIARSCGVYSTPQAAIIDADRHLYYRGNYNKSRYCIDEKSNYARMAVDSFLHHTATPLLGMAAYTSYGCQVITCKK